MKSKIIILQRIIPHYRVGFFEKFCKKFPDAKILYGQPYGIEELENAKGLSKENFVFCPNIYLESKGRIFFSRIYTKLYNFRPEIVISVFNVGNLNLYILIFLRMILKFKLILWSFGYDPSTGFNPDKKFADKMRLFLSQKADAVIFYWEDGRKEVEQFSKKTSHYFIAPNTLDTEKLFQYKEEFDNVGKQKIKTELGVVEKFHFIYSGRLLKDKEIDVLLKIFKSVEAQSSDCRLSIIGAGAEKTKLLKLAEDLKLHRVHFIGEILDEYATGKWIYISDAFIMPGRLGLSVAHSFSFGTPVISQRKEKYFHGEGVGYIKNGVNGFLTEDKNPEEMVSKILEIISKKDLAEKLKLNAFETAKSECSVEKMMKGFEDAIKYVQRKEIYLFLKSG